MTTAADDLLEFATTERKRPGIPCVVCQLPERSIIDEAKRAARRGTVGGGMVRRWLIAKHGYTDETAPKSNSFDQHFHNGHHREAAA